MFFCIACDGIRERAASNLQAQHCRTLRTLSDLILQKGQRRSINKKIYFGTRVAHGQYRGSYLQRVRAPEVLK